MKAVCMLLQGHYEIDIRVRRKAEALTSAGYHVDVLALRSSFSKSETYTLNGVNVYTLALGKKRGSLPRYIFEYLAFFVWAALKLPGLMRRHEYAVIDVNTLPDFLVFAALPAKWQGAKIVLDMHEITPEFYISKYGIKKQSLLIRLLEYVERISMNYADHVITINEPIQKLLETRGLPGSKCTIIMNSADENLFTARSDAVRLVDADERKGTFVMMYHGTLTHIYGLDITIEAFSMAQERMPKAELWILGGGPEKCTLENLAQKRGVESSVKFVGTVLPQEVHEWLRRCDIGVLATRQDIFLDYSFSNKISEYIIMGKAVIASRLKTIRYYFSEDAVAFFEPMNTSELAEKMVMLYGQSNLRTRLAETAKQEFQPLRWEIMRDRYLGLISEMIDRGAERDAVLNADA